jgi:hypothetical protein
MALTPESESSAYADASDLEARYDLRVLLRLASDEGESIPAGTLASSARVLAALAEASGEVESACAAGRRYAPSDLALLTGNSLAKLKGIVCGLAMAKLQMGRPTEQGAPPVMLKAAEDALVKLHSGERVFGFTESMNAELTSADPETPAERANRRGTVTIASRFFGKRTGDYDRP